MRGLRAAVTFLTRVKVGGEVRWPEDIARGVPWFPLVGCAVGVLVAAVYAAGLSILPSFVAAAVAVAVGVVTTGALHEDGLADTADAFGARRPPDEAVRILKDPRLGSYGVLAIVLAMVLRIGGVSALDGPAAFVLLPAAGAMSRAAAIALLAGPVAGDGLGAAYASVVGGWQLAIALAVGGAVGIALLGPLALPAEVGVAAACLITGGLARRRIGGVTGDVLGAAQQSGELLVLLVGVGALHRGWADLPWW